MSLAEVTRNLSASIVSKALFSVPLRLRQTAVWHWLRPLPSFLRANDLLTGLLARQEFMRRATRWLQQGSEPTLVLFDVDRLKYANDALGHEAVDAVLIALAHTVRRLASGDLTARYGGDEFVVLVDKRQRAEELAKQVRSSVASQFCAERTRIVAARPELAGKPLLTLSVGAASYVPGQKLSMLVQRADAALSEAKDAGRDCIKWARP